MKRIFVAIPVNFELLGLTRSFVSLNDSMLHEGPLKKFRWTREENLHITLLFVGEVEEKLIAELTEKVKIVSSGKQPFELKFDTFSFAANRKSPRMIWASFKPSHEFATLHHQLIEGIGSIKKVEAGRENPIPHITLARFTPVKNHGLFLKQPSQKKNLTVRSFELWQSNFGKEGVSYESLAVFPLG